jgi:hypothetical protein
MADLQILAAVEALARRLSVDHLASHISSQEQLINATHAHYPQLFGVDSREQRVHWHEELTWAWLVVTTRSFAMRAASFSRVDLSHGPTTTGQAVVDDNAEVRVLVPLVDMMSHDNEGARVSLGSPVSDQPHTVVTSRTYKQARRCLLPIVRLLSARSKHGCTCTPMKTRVKA